MRITSIPQHFEHMHNNPPSELFRMLGLNLDYNPNSKDWYKMVSQSMEDDNFYDTHTREECRVEWAKRYTKLKENNEN